MMFMEVSVCMFFNSEVILANLLNYYPNSNYGVDIMLIERYCNNIKNLLSGYKRNKTDFILFQINEYEMENNVYAFPKHFIKFMGRYYKGDFFDLTFFENRYQNVEYLNDVFHNAALNLDGEDEVN